MSYFLSILETRKFYIFNLFIHQLKKEGRRNEYEMHKLLALNQRQKMVSKSLCGMAFIYRNIYSLLYTCQVLQRKTEEANMATKRLKELLESKKTSRETPGHNAPGIQVLVA